MRMSVGELSARLGVSRTRVSAWENHRGLPDAANLQRIALALETSADYLLGLDLIFATRVSKDPGFKLYREAPIAREMREEGESKIATPPATAEAGSHQPSDAERFAALERQLEEMRQLVERLAQPPVAEVVPAPRKKRVRSA